MKFSVHDSAKEALLNDLQAANLQFQKTYPGDKPDRQPVHTVYGGANLFKSDTCIKMGGNALRSLQPYAPNFAVLARVLSLKGHDHLPTTEEGIAQLTTKLDAMSEEQRKAEPAWLSYAVYNKIIHKLNTEPV